jgi:hypothetical protein
MTPAEIMKVLQSKNQLLTQKNDEYIELTQKKAQAERDYNVAFATQLISERLDGTPITIAKELCKGNKAVSKLKMDFEVRIGIEKACLESMKDIREAIGSARSILTWMRTELESR